MSSPVLHLGDWLVSRHADAAVRSRGFAWSDVLRTVQDPEVSYEQRHECGIRHVRQRGHVAVVVSPATRTVITVLLRAPHTWTDQDALRANGSQPAAGPGGSGSRRQPASLRREQSRTPATDAGGRPRPRCRLSAASGWRRRSGRIEERHMSSPVASARSSASAAPCICRTSPAAGPTASRVPSATAPRRRRSTTAASRFWLAVTSMSPGADGAPTAKRTDRPGQWPGPG